MRVARKITVSILVVCSFIFVFANVASAHPLVIEFMEEGIVKVAYEDGHFSRRTEVLVYDEDNKEIIRGPLDGAGLFYYPEEAYLIVADDGLGHRAEWKVGEVTSGLPRALTVLVVVCCFILIAGFFSMKTSFRGFKSTASKG